MNPVFPAVIAAVGVALFLSVLRDSRARMAGLAAFGLFLMTSVVGLALPKQMLSTSWLMAVSNWTILAGLVGDVLLLGVVHSLRSLDSPRADRTERFLGWLLGLVFLGVLAFAVVFGRLWTWHYVASAAVMVLALLGVMFRFGMTGTGLGFLAGFGLLLVADLLGIAIAVSPEVHEMVPWQVVAWLHLFGLGGVVASLALASRNPHLERAPWPGESPEWGKGRWLALGLILVGTVTCAALGFAASELRLFGAGGFHGRAAVAVFLIPAWLMYLCLVGAFGIVRGSPRFSRSFLR